MFDNMHIFSFSKSPPQDIVFSLNYPKLNPKYHIVFTRQYSTDQSLLCNKDRNDSFRQLYKECALQFQEQGLNIINRQRFFGANYTQLHRREDKYYSLRNLGDMEIWPQQGIDLQYPDLRCLCGYKSTVTYATNCIVKTQLAHKLITKHSIHDFIAQHGVDKVDRFIRGKRAVTSYSNQIIELDGLDSTKNLDSTFELDKGQTISFRDYY